MHTPKGDRSATIQGSESCLAQIEEPLGKAFPYTRQMRSPGTLPLNHDAQVTPTGENNHHTAGSSAPGLCRS